MFDVLSNTLHAWQGILPLTSSLMPRFHCISTRYALSHGISGCRPRLSASLPDSRSHWFPAQSTYCATAWSCSASPQARIMPLTCAVPTTATTALTPGSGSYRPSPSAGGLTPAAGLEGLSHVNMWCRTLAAGFTFQHTQSMLV